MNATLATSQTAAEYTAAGGQLHSTENQRILSKLVEREVVHCCSSLVSHFSQNEEALTGSDYSLDELYDLCQRRYDNTDEIAELEETIETLENEISDLEDLDEPTADDIATLDAKQKELVKLEAEKEELEEQQENPDDVYEHWIVSKWFAEQLAGFGETTGELFDFTIWGRCTTGQSISLDYVIAQVAAEMGILTGQKYDWKD